MEQVLSEKDLRTIEAYRKDFEKGSIGVIMECPPCDFLSRESAAIAQA